MASHHETVRVIFSEDFFDAPLDSLRNVASFLGLAPSHKFDVTYIKNNHNARGVAPDSHNALASESARTSCLPNSRVSADAHALMRSSVRETSQLLAPFGYRVPDAWWKPPPSC
jgi:hypothetical protein